MDKSDTITKISAALAKAQADIDPASKSKTNPHFRSKYADLGNVVDAIKPALTKHGLSFIQVSHDSNNSAQVETIILHESGEWISCGIVSVPVSKSDAQGYGSALTYARRYSLSAAFGVAPEDDDGNAAAKAKPQPDEDKVADHLAAMDSAESLDALQAAFKEAWTYAKGIRSSETQKAFQEAYNGHKAKFQEAA